MNSLLLGVNIDHVATLRNARGTSYPDPLKAGLAAERAGADLITVHLREDRRHIREQDVIALLAQLTIRLNLEMAATDEMIAFACLHRPSDCCLVPEKRQEVTTEGGLDLVANEQILRPQIEALVAAGICVSLFIDPEPKQIQLAADLKAPVVELHTGAYADALSPQERATELTRLQQAAKCANELGLRCNAGHGLTFDNVDAVAQIGELVELNIGHSLIADAIFLGLENSVSRMKNKLDRIRAAV